MTIKVALDSNVLVYAHELDDPQKQQRAVDLLDDYPIVSSQVVSEYLNVLRRKLPGAKDATLHTAWLILSKTQLVMVGLDTILLAKRLTRRYQFQLFDSIIVASAIQSGCNILYSEDMQDGMLVEDSFSIVNPFL